MPRWLSLPGLLCSLTVHHSPQPNPAGSGGAWAEQPVRRLQDSERCSSHYHYLFLLSTEKGRNKGEWRQFAMELHVSSEMAAEPGAIPLRSTTVGLQPGASHLDSSPCSRVRAQAGGQGQLSYCFPREGSGSVEHLPLQLLAGGRGCHFSPKLTFYFCRNHGKTSRELPPEESAAKSFLRRSQWRPLAVWFPRMG